MLQLVRTLQPAIAEKLPVFSSEEFLSAKSPEYGWFLSDRFVLPFVVDGRLRKVGFKRVVFTTDTVDLYGDPSVEEERRFLDKVVQLCSERRHLNVDYMAAQANAVFRVVPTKSETLPWGSYVVDLKRSDAAIFNSFESGLRNRIRKGIKDGVVVSTTNDIDCIYETTKQTMERQSLLFYPSRDYLYGLQQNLRQNITFYVARQADQIQGSAVVVHNKLGAFYYYGGSAAEPSPGSLPLMQYEIMKDLMGRGIPTYDLMGARLTANNDAKIEGIQKFKRRFASGMRTGFCFRKILHPVRHRVLITAVKTFFFLKGSQYEGDVFDQARRVEACATA